jgi:hypothetical protein
MLAEASAKWYAWSGGRRLVVEATSPTQANLELVQRAVDADEIAQLGHFVRCSERGFGRPSHTTHWTPQLLASLGVPNANRLKLRNEF